MPLTKEQKLSILTKLNVDPSKYWMDDNGTILDLPEQGTAETALKSTLYNAPRTALGFGGGALGAAGAGLVGAPSGPGAIATGVAGSMAGSMAGSSIAQGLMDAVYPESWRLGQEAREARSPGTVFASDVLASTALMRPSPTVLKQAARIPGDLMRSGGQIQPQNLAAGLNIAIGSGLGAGQALASGGSASDVLMQGAIGALQHQPTALGQRASFGIFQPTVDVGPMPLMAARKAYADALAEQRLKQQTELADQNLANYPRTMQRMAEESNPLIERSADFVDPDAQERINAAVDILPLLAKTEQPPAARPEVSPVTLTAAENVTPAESARGEALRGASKIEQEQQMLPAPDLNDYLNAWADKFHTTVNEAAGLKDAAGREVGGVTTPRLTPGGETVTTINPKGYVDVRPHEALHSFLHDVLNFGSAGEQKMMRRILKELGAEPTKGSDGLWRVDPAAEEAIVQPAGEAVFRGIKDRKSVNAKDAMMDFMDYYLRNKVDKESALRMLSNRATFGSGAPSKVQKARMAGRPPTVEDRRDDLEEAANVAQERIAKQAEAEPVVEPEVLPAEEGAQITPEEEAPGYAPRLKSVKYEAPEEPRVLTPEDVAPGSEVGQPEVIDYPGTSIPQNVRRGRMERESALETPEDLEMRRIEARLAGEERPRYQPLEEDRARIFSTDFEKELTQERPFRIQVAKDDRMSRNDILAAVKKLNPSEQEMLKEAGLDRFLAKIVRPNTDELRKWVEENVPRVEVKELSAEGLDTPEQTAYAKLRHEYDTLGKFPQMVFDGRSTGGQSAVDYYYPNSNGREERVELDPNSQEFQKALEWERLGKIVEKQGGSQNDSATRAYTQANPRELGDMPGAVDLLVRYPRKNRTEQEIESEFQKRPYGGAVSEQHPAKYPANATHYPQSGDNLLAHVRAYEHTLPNGEKVLRVFEVQSDWAQAHRKFIDKLKDRIRKGDDGKFYFTERGGHSKKFDSEAAALDYAKENYSDVVDDPLLAHHQRLALKAAIEYARRNGISKVVVDDAETAMMTEGHDKARSVLNIPENVTKLKDAGYDIVASKLQSGTRIDFNDFGSTGARELSKLNLKTGITQERGMRLAYDNVLQQHMRDLAGEGVKVDLGLHKNATIGANERGEYTQLRDDLIFRNPDGTPKTHSTGFLYDVSAPQERRAAGEPFSYTGRRYQPLGPDRAEYKGTKLPEREQPFRGIFAGNVEALRRSGDPAKAKFADSAVELYARIRNYTGKYEDAVLPKFLRASPETRNKIVETLYEEDQKGAPLRSTLDPKEQEIYDQVRAGLKLMRTDQIAANHLVDGRPAKMDATYFPNTVDRSIIHDLTYNPTSARAQEAERQFIDYNVDRFVAKGMTQAQAQASAEKAFGKFVGSLKPMSIDSGFDFAAVSMPAGTKLPATWISADPVQGLRNYIRRFSRARAFHDVIGKDEDAMRAIGRKFYYGPNGQETQVTNPGSRIVRDPNVRALLENAIGVTHESQEGITPALGRLANTLLLSNVMSRLTDVATTPFKALTYLPPQHIPGLLANMRNIRQSIQNAYKTGGARRGDMLVMRDVLGAGDVAINKIDKLSEYITKYTGSEAIEKGSRMLAQNVGEYVYDVNKRLADSGDKRALAFFERLTPKWRTLDRIEVSQRIAQLFQGSYDATNLPIWIQNSPAAPFFSMMKWNVEQWNNFKRHAIEPARNGDIVPLVSTIIGGIVGGVAVGELREALSGKKQRVASFNELAYGFSQGDKTRAATEATRKLAFLAQVTGTLGVIGELGLQGVDIMAKDKPQGFSWPAFDLASDVLGKAQNAVAAIVDRPQDAGTITTAVVHDLARDVFSQYRLASAAADKLRGSGETIEANRRRDLRMSEKLRGEPTRFSPMVQADYKNAKERAFDRTRDMGKAKELARELRSTAREESRTGEEYKAAMRKLGTSRISGIPSRENSPQQYAAHLNYVRATQGDKAAQELAQEYGRLRAEQQMKASLFK